MKAKTGKSQPIFTKQSTTLAATGAVIGMEIHPLFLYDVIEGQAEISWVGEEM